LRFDPRRFVLAAALAASAAEGCTLVFPLDGYGDGGSDAASGSDAPTIDAHSIDCDGHTFCDDFDHDALAAIWNVTNTAADATIGLTSDVFVSPPNSMNVFSPASTSQETYALEHIAVPITSHAHVELDLMIQAGPGNAGVQVDFIKLSVPAVAGFQPVGIHLSRLASASQIFEKAYPTDGGNATITTNPLTFLFDQWTHVVFDVDIPAQTCTLTVGGTLATVLALTPNIAPGAWDLVLGVTFQQNLGQPYVIWMDNVVVDSK
jgi:hypothetical protein